MHNVHFVHFVHFVRFVWSTAVKDWRRRRRDPLELAI